MTKNNETGNLIKKIVTKTRSRTIYKSTVNNEVYFFKKYINHSYIKIWQDIFRAQRATRFLLTSKYLQKRSIPTYEICFAVVNKYGLFRRSSMIVTKEYHGISLKQFFQQDQDKKLREQVIEAFIDLFVKMLKNNIFHRDPNLSNFIWENNKIKLIDLDDIKIIPKITGKIFLKNIRILNRILLRSYIRSRNGKINIGNEERKYIIQSIIKKYDTTYDIDQTWKYVERHTTIKAAEITRFIENK